MTFTISAAVIVLGVEERNGHPLLPPKGLDPEQIDSIQQELLKLGYSAIQPYYHPISGIYNIEGRTILILWAPGGETRPHKPEAERFWNFPIEAIEETLVNAIYHRSYEEREPVEVRITPEELVILSFPGPPCRRLLTAHPRSRADRNDASRQANQSKPALSAHGGRACPGTINTRYD